MSANPKRGKSVRRELSREEQEREEMEEVEDMEAEEIEHKKISSPRSSLGTSDSGSDEDSEGDLSGDEIERRMASITTENPLQIAARKVKGESQKGTSKKDKKKQATGKEGGNGDGVTPDVSPSSKDDEETKESAGQGEKKGKKKDKSKQSQTPQNQKKAPVPIVLVDLDQPRHSPLFQWCVTVSFWCLVIYILYFGPWVGKSEAEVLELIQRSYLNFYQYASTIMGGLFALGSIIYSMKLLTGKAEKEIDV